MKRRSKLHRGACLSTAALPINLLSEKRGSVTMMGVGMLPVFLLLAGIITLILFFWSSYARLITAAEAGALTAVQSMQDGGDNLSTIMDESSINQQDLSHRRLAKRVQHAVVQNGGGPHGEIICTGDHEVQVIARLKVLGRWEIYARGSAPKQLTTLCNWRKIPY